jgi:putative glycosyl hydrolase
VYVLPLHPHLTFTSASDLALTDDNADNFDSFTHWIDSVCDLAGNRPVAITEVSQLTSFTLFPRKSQVLTFGKQFQGYGPIDAQMRLLDRALPYLDGNECVSHYSYMGATNAGTEMLNGDGLSDLGQKYAFA